MLDILAHTFDALPIFAKAGVILFFGALTVAVLRP